MMAKNVWNKFLTIHVRHHMSPATIASTMGQSGGNTSTVVYYCLPLSVSSGSRALTSRRAFSSSSNSNSKDGDNKVQKPIDEATSIAGEQQPAASNSGSDAASPTASNITGAGAEGTSTPSSSSSSATPTNNAPNSSNQSSTPSKTTGPATSAVRHHLDYTTLRNTTVQRLGDTIHFAEQQYQEAEQLLMKRINESNRRRFRLYFFGSIIFIIVTTVIFGDRMRKSFTEKTAGLAKETLENESLKIQTQELAMAVVQTILNDKEITAHAATFLKEASSAAETQQALLELTMHVLQHPQTFDELLKLSQKLIIHLGKDKEVLNSFVQVVAKVFESPEVNTALVKLAVDLFKDPEVLQAVTELTLTIINKQEMTDATVALLGTSTTELLEDQELIKQSQQFIAEVVGDDLLHREGGDALWKTVLHALKPGVIRMTGFGLVVASVAALKLFISPF